MIVAGIVMGIVAGALFGIRAALLKKAAESTNELLPFYLSVACLILIFLVMSVLRIWFDLAETDVVLSDQRAVRKSIAAGFRHTWRGSRPSAGKLCSDHDCRHDYARSRALGVDEVCPSGQRGRSDLRQPVDAPPAVDSAFLAARRRSDLLPAIYGGTHCRAVVFTSAGRCASGE